MTDETNFNEADSSIDAEFDAWIAKMNALDTTPQLLELFSNIKAALPELEILLAECKSEYTNCFYRFYHQSYKVYYAQHLTHSMVCALAALMPKYEMNKDFLHIVKEGTGREFERSVNKDWINQTKPMLDACHHAMFFLEAAITCAREMDAPRCTISHEWGLVLHLFNLRSTF